ncbi:hypothetical protein [Sulfoacidibacillus ferrooxidans]|uniref:Cytotoxin n=1 Tax=Sulfoacidibacillus ferrooxidans TaxID=2005001 RepID=A0A9X1VBD2_9BACL|nr:hypothetical protein [Sulfoacidibacillus ferrooxidans]MCI0184724.1 hypothetical protein [Sulfoacidibacillus ferrooxidans]
MNIELSRRFEKQYHRLVNDDQHLRISIQNTLAHLLNFPPVHPSLRLKRVKGTDGIYECSVNMDVRITLEFAKEGVFLLGNIDHHDEALRKP